MGKAFRWISTIPVMALSLFMWSCDNVGDMTQPELAPSPMVVMSTSGYRYVVAVERNPAAASVSATIGSAGGMLYLDKHSLWVSPGAVTKATRFTMTRHPESALRVQLTAGRDSENDVGSVGFKAPVRLALSYQSAEDVPKDKSTITIVSIRPDGLVEELTTEVRVIGRIAVATVPHFSEYALAWP